MEIQTAEENLFKNLSSEQIEQIGDDVSKVLLGTWNEKLIFIKTLQKNSNQLKYDLEKEVSDVNALLQNEVSFRCDIEGKLKALEDDFQKANDHIFTQSKELEVCCNEQKNLTATIAAKNCSIDNLEKELNSLQKDLDNALKAKAEAVLKAEDSNVYQIKLEYKEKQFEEEKIVLTKQCDYLKGQLEECNTELKILRQAHSDAALNIQSSLNKSVEETKFLQGERDSLKKSMKQKEMELQNISDALNASRESECRLEETFSQQLSSQQTLADMYKALSEGQQKKCKELEDNVKELKQLLQTSDEKISALENFKKKLESEAEVILQEKLGLIENLRKELDKANEKVSQKYNFHEGVSPSEVPSKETTITQIYTQYMESCEKLLQAEEESRRMHRYVDQILQAIEENAPTLTQQKLDYIELKKVNQTLREEVGQFSEDLDKLRDMCEEAQRRSNYLSKENGRLSQQVKDLSKQVTVLLTEIEAAKTGFAPPPPSVVEENFSESSNDDVISQNFVTFRNVTELQEQNRTLLESIRDMTAKVETVEKTVVEEKTRQVQKELDISKNKVEELTFIKGKMESMMEALKSERDFYRTIANQKKSTTFSEQTPSKDGELISRELSSAQEEIAKWKKIYEEYRTERNKNSDLEKEELNRLKSSYKKVNNENIRLQTKVESNDQNINTLQKLCDSYRSQLKSLEERNKLWQGIAGRHENSIQTLKEELNSICKKLSQEEIANAQSKEEIALLKKNIIYLTAERDHLQHAELHHNKININLQVIKNRLDFKEAKLAIKKENQITDLTKQCNLLKSKLEDNAELNEAKLKLEKMQAELNDSKQECTKIKKELTEGKQQVKTLQAQIQDLQNKQNIKIPSPSKPLLPTPMQSPGGSLIRPGMPLGGNIRELQFQLNEEKNKVSSLHVNLNASQKEVSNLKQLLTQQESKYKDANETTIKSNQVISQLKKELEDTKKSVNDLTDRLKASEKNVKVLKESCSEHLTKVISLEGKEMELEEAQRHLKDAKKIVDDIVLEKEKLNKLTSEAQDKYQREVILHSKDLKSLTALKEKLAIHNSEIDKITACKLKVEEKLANVTAQFEEKDLQFKKYSEEHQSRIKDLESQNHSLLQQFTELSEKMSSLESKMSSEDVNVSITEEDMRSSDQLREVIKYLRSERDLAIHKTKVVVAETQCLDAQKKSLEAQIIFLNKNLTEEKAKYRASTEESSEYKELLMKAQNLDAISDSNRLLREERNQLSSTIEEHKAKSSSLESQIGPLQEKVKDATNKLDSVMIEKKKLEEERNVFKRRTQELTETLNKFKPDDFIKYQNQLKTSVKQNEDKQAEIVRLKNMNAKLTKSYHGALQEKKTLQQKVDEANKVQEEMKKLNQERERLQAQLSQSHEKLRGLEANMNQMQTVHQEENANLLQQIVEFRKSLEENRLQLQTREKKLEEQKTVIKTSQDKIENLEKQSAQLRKICIKYKKMSEVGQEASANTSGECSKDDSVKKVEEAGESSSVSKDEYERMKSQKESLENEKETSTKQIIELTNKLEKYKALVDETQKKQALYENRMTLLNKEKEELNKKLLMQQKQMGKFQKQTTNVSKGSSSAKVIEKMTDAPPTANIKPMAASVTPIASSRAQPSVQSGSGSSKIIPTASIKPLTPSAVVAPMEPYGTNDGAVSSTVTLPLATVTPTPAVPTHTAVTATVSPTPVSVSIAAISTDSSQSGTNVQSVQSSSLSVQSSTTNEAVLIPIQDEGVALNADCIISQALALVASDGDLFEDSQPAQPQPSGNARKRKIDEELIGEDPKRSCVENTGEPSSSSQLAVKKPQDEIEDDSEIMIVQSGTEVTQTREERMTLGEEAFSKGHSAMAAGNEERNSDSRHSVVDEHGGNTMRGQTQTFQEQPTSSRQSLSQFQTLNQLDDGRIFQSPFVPGDIASDGVSSPMEEFVAYSTSSEAISTSQVESGQIGEEKISGVSRTGATLSEGDTPKTFIAGESSSEGNITSSAGGEDSAEMEGSSLLQQAGSSAGNTGSKQEEPDSGLERSSGVEEKKIESGQLQESQRMRPIDYSDGDSSDAIPIADEARSPRSIVTPPSPPRRTTPADNSSQATRGYFGRGQASARQLPRGRAPRRAGGPNRRYRRFYM